MNEDIEQMLLDTFKAGPNFSSTACTSATGPKGQTLTAADILAALDKLKPLGPEPIAEWMIKQGCHPSLWVAVLPERFKVELPFWPEYIRFSAAVEFPVLARRYI